MGNIYDITREIPDNLSNMLENFLDNYKKEGLSDSNVYLFYEFILKSYESDRKNRYSIKLLAEELQKRNLNVSLIINIYYHTLNCLALKDGLEIYGKGFLI